VGEEEREHRRRQHKEVGTKREEAGEEKGRG
jgi:hypothetical protein